MHIIIIHPVVTLVLAWVIDRPVATGYQPNKCYIVVVTWGIRAFPEHDMYALFPRACGPQVVGHTYQVSPHAHVTTITYALLPVRISS